MENLDKIMHMFGDGVQVDRAQEEAQQDAPKATPDTPAIDSWDRMMGIRHYTTEGGTVYVSCPDWQSFDFRYTKLMAEQRAREFDRQRAESLAR